MILQERHISSMETCRSLVRKNYVCTYLTYRKFDDWL